MWKCSSHVLIKQRVVVLYTHTHTHTNIKKHTVCMHSCTSMGFQCVCVCVMRVPLRRSAARPRVTGTKCSNPDDILFETTCEIFTPFFSFFLPARCNRSFPLAAYCNIKSQDGGSASTFDLQLQLGRPVTVRDARFSSVSLSA